MCHNCYDKENTFVSPLRPLFRAGLPSTVCVEVREVAAAAGSFLTGPIPAGFLPPTSLLACGVAGGPGRLASSLPWRASCLPETPERWDLAGAKGQLPCLTSGKRKLYRTTRRVPTR